MSSRNRRWSGQEGFTMVAVLGVVLISSIVCLAAFQAAKGDLSSSGDNAKRRQAYAAAESGIAWYLAKLNADPNYWQRCDTGVTNSVADPVNQANVTNDASRKWQVLDGSTAQDKSEFSLAVLPKDPAVPCSATDPLTMLRTDGSFHIRSTGRYRDKKVSIVTSFKRRRFLDFVEFFDYFTFDPILTGTGTTCVKYWQGGAGRPASCNNVYYAGGEGINGPLHTNDELFYCGNPVFGRNGNDNVTVSGPAPGQNKIAGCGDSGVPDVKGAFRFDQRALQMPPTNAALKTLTTAGTSGQGYLLTGTTYIRLNGSTMVIDTPTGDPYTANIPPNGVIYVQGDTALGCTNLTQTYNGNTNDPVNPRRTMYQEGPGCGNLYVSGSTSKSITLAAERDIIVAPTRAVCCGSGTANQFDPATSTAAAGSADLTTGTLNSSTRQITGSVLIGLIANQYIRAYHRVNSFPVSNPRGATNDTAITDIRIDCACISLQHSFFVDNYGYAPTVGRLKLQGSVTQRFTGVHASGAGTGMIQDYYYDDRLRYQAPPNFLDPVNSAWGTARETELTPAV